MEELNSTQKVILYLSRALALLGLALFFLAMYKMYLSVFGNYDGTPLEIIKDKRAHRPSTYLLLGALISIFSASFLQWVINLKDSQSAKSNSLKENLSKSCESCGNQNGKSDKFCSQCGIKSELSE